MPSTERHIGMRVGMCHPGHPYMTNLRPRAAAGALLLSRSPPSRSLINQLALLTVCQLTWSAAAGGSAAFL